MVNVYGQWIEDASCPKERWCDMDYIADWIRSKGYSPKTTMGNLIDNIFNHYDHDEDVIENGYFAVEDSRPYPDCLMVNVEDVAEYIQASGGLQEFDY